MSELRNLCHICGKPSEHTCKLCGKPVCSRHYDAKLGICDSCRRGRQLK